MDGTTGRHTSKRSMLGFVAGNILYQGLSWLVVLLLARYRGTVVVGQYALGLAITTPIFLFAHLQLRILLITESLSLSDLHSLWKLRTAALLLASIASVAVSLYLAEPDTLPVLLTVICTRVAEGLSDLCHAVFQRLDRLTWVTVSLVVRGGVVTVLLLISLATVAAYVVDILAVAFGTLIVLISVDLVLYRSLRLDSRLPASPTPYRTIVQQGASLGGVSLLTNFGTNIPRYFLYRSGGDHLLGVFSLLYYFAVAAGMIADIMGHALQRSFTRRFQAGLHPIRKRHLLVLLAASASVGAALYAAGYYFGPAFMRTTYNIALDQGREAAGLILLTSALLATARILRYPMNSMGLFRAQLHIAAAALAISGGTALATVWRSPLHGAALSLAALVSVELLLNSATLLAINRSRPPAPGEPLPV